MLTIIVKLKQQEIILWCKPMYLKIKTEFKKLPKVKKSSYQARHVLYKVMCWVMINSDSNFFIETLIKICFA